MKNIDSNLRLSRPFAIALTLTVLTGAGFGGYELYCAEMAYRESLAVTLASLQQGSNDTKRSVEQARVDTAEANAKLRASDVALSEAIERGRKDLATSNDERAIDQKSMTAAIKMGEQRATATEEQMVGVESELREHAGAIDQTRKEVAVADQALDTRISVAMVDLRGTQERIGVAESVITDMHSELSEQEGRISTVDETLAVVVAREDPSQLSSGSEEQLLELKARMMELGPAVGTMAAVASARAELKALLGQFMLVQLDRRASEICAIEWGLVLLEALSVDVPNEEAAMRVIGLLEACGANPSAPIPAELEPSVAARAKECKLLVHSAEYRMSLAQIQAQVSAAMRLPTINARGVGLTAARENLNRVAATATPNGVDVSASDGVLVQINNAFAADAERQRTYETWASNKMDEFVRANDVANGLLWDDEEAITDAIQQCLVPIDGNCLPSSMQQRLQLLMASGLSELYEADVARATSAVTKVKPENF